MCLEGAVQSSSYCACHRVVSRQFSSIIPIARPRWRIHYCRPFVPHPRCRHRHHRHRLMGHLSHWKSPHGISTGWVSTSRVPSWRVTSRSISRRRHMSHRRRMRMPQYVSPRRRRWWRRWWGLHPRIHIFILLSKQSHSFQKQSIITTAPFFTLPTGQKMSRIIFT